MQKKKKNTEEQAETGRQAGSSAAWAEGLTGAESAEEAGAAILRDLHAPAILSCLSRLADQGFDVPAAKTYVDHVIAGSARVGDPLERMLLEHATILHIAATHLQHAVTDQKDPETLKAFSAAANRMSGEFRRQVLALRVYQAPEGKRSFTAVRQQNVASHQQVHLHEGGDGRVDDRDEPEGGDHHVGGRLGERFEGEESEACRGRAEEPAEAGTARR